MDIYHWIFCRKNGKYYDKNLKKLDFPFKIKEREVIISKSELEKELLKFSNYLEREIDFKKLYEIFYEKTGGEFYDPFSNLWIKDPNEGFDWYWLILAKAFEERYGIFPIRDDRFERLLFNIYSNPNIPILGKFVYGFAYLFAFYRLWMLEKGGRNIRVIE